MRHFHSPRSRHDRRACIRPVRLWCWEDATAPRVETLEQSAARRRSESDRLFAQGKRLERRETRCDEERRNIKVGRRAGYEGRRDGSVEKRARREVGPPGVSRKRAFREVRPPGVSRRRAVLAGNVRPSSRDGDARAQLVRLRALHAQCKAPRRLRRTKRAKSSPKKRVYRSFERVFLA